MPFELYFVQYNTDDDGSTRVSFAQSIFLDSAQGARGMYAGAAGPLGGAGAIVAHVPWHARGHGAAKRLLQPCLE